jgi:thiosulfate/3-mercaptopyruvate sulfurtransferase
MMFRMLPALVSPAQLRSLPAADGLLVVDCRHDLAIPGAGREAFRAGHVPGARFAHLDEDLSGGKTGRNGRHPLPAREAFAQKLRSWGLNRGAPVVAYDAGPGIFAARLWWMLRWMGHANAAVLDGGWQAWVRAGGEVSAGTTPGVPPGDFVAGEPLERVATAAEVLALLGRREHIVVDARSPDRFEGRNENLDPVGGHIPGAVNRFWQGNLGEAGRFLDAARLRAHYEALLAGRPPGAAILQCGSGVTACHNALAMHVAGLPGARLYAGSWSEWVADPSRPVATGP